MLSTCSRDVAYDKRTLFGAPNPVPGTRATFSSSNRAFAQSSTVAYPDKATASFTLGISKMPLAV